MAGSTGGYFILSSLISHNRILHNPVPGFSRPSIRVLDDLFPAFIYCLDCKEEMSRPHISVFVIL